MAGAVVVGGKDVAGAVVGGAACLAVKRRRVPRTADSSGYGTACDEKNDKDTGDNQCRLLRFQGRSGLPAAPGGGRGGGSGGGPGTCSGGPAAGSGASQ
jgi:hypothetical protein